MNMCTQCTSKNTCCTEKLIEKQLEGKDTKRLENSPKGILDHLSQQFENLWMLSAKLECMGQVLTKRLRHGSGSSSGSGKKYWKVLRSPCVVRSVLVFLALFYFGIPVWFYFCPWLRRGAVFLHFADWPFQNFASPESYGLQCTRNFFIETTPGVSLGAWHVFPQSLRCSPDSLQQYSFNDDDKLVILYLHGSAESRSAAYRRSMYRVLTADPVDSHVITFDYRGFGDSTPTSPTVTTLEEDAAHVYWWLRKRVPASRVVIWGHSMGTGVAVRLGVQLAKGLERPFAIVLEAPFTSVADATRTFPLSFFHRKLPLFQQFCSDRTRHQDTDLDSESRIGRLEAPILILHAADDSMVWAEQGRRLWRRALQDRPGHLQAPVFVELDGKYGCGHRNIHKAPELPGEVRRFLQGVRDKNGID